MELRWCARKRRAFLKWREMLRRILIRTTAENLAETIERLGHSSELRASLKAKGLQRAKQFTWQEFTRKHLEVYYRFLSRN